MADLSVTFAGIRSPNPFWLASGPPTNSARQVHRAFEAGWGGAVWKTIGEPIVNTSSRYSALRIGGNPIAGFNNIELISDRSPETNFREIAEVKNAWPDRVVIASLMVETREQWREFIARSEQAGADAIELNFGCPHGMCERGMGSAVGQNPEALRTITSWALEFSRIPVIVKLTPNITDIREPARAARQAGAHAISLINTISSITNVDLSRMSSEPSVAGLSSHGGYCGPAVKPVALNMVHACASDPAVALPISGIGGISNWHDAAEFIALGAGTVQVCTAVMHHGFRIVQDLIGGLSSWLDTEGHASPEAIRGAAVPNITDWNQLDLRYRRIARIDHALCIGCNLCHIACEDGAHQSIELADASDFPKEISARFFGRPIPRVLDSHCVGCNLCACVCPVEGCITMVDLPPVEGESPMSWRDYQTALAEGRMEALPPHP